MTDGLARFYGGSQPGTWPRTATHRISEIGDLFDLLPRLDGASCSFRRCPSVLSLCYL